jgi:RNase P subunit RPR2
MIMLLTDFSTAKTHCPNCDTYLDNSTTSFFTILSHGKILIQCPVCNEIIWASFPITTIKTQRNKNEAEK